MENAHKRNEKKVNIIFRLPLVRHCRAVFELLIMFFWRNYFGDGLYVQPHVDEVNMIYDIWYGKEKSRQMYIPNAVYLKIEPFWKRIIGNIKRKRWARATQRLEQINMGYILEDEKTPVLSKKNK